jgi:hypothetical protein
MATIIARIKPAQATARPKLFPVNDVEYHDRTPPPKKQPNLFYNNPYTHLIATDFNTDSSHPQRKNNPHKFIA